MTWNCFFGEPGGQAMPGASAVAAGFAGAQGIPCQTQNASRGIAALQGASTNGDVDVLFPRVAGSVRLTRSPERRSFQYSHVPRGCG